MKTAAEVLCKTSTPTPSNGLQTSSARQEAIDHADLVAALWRGMTALYGKSWQQYDTPDARNTWAMGLRRLTRQMVLDGLHALRDKHTGKYPPNLPEFRALCLAEVRERAFADLLAWLRGGWFTDPAAYAVYLRVDSYDWRHMDTQRVRARFDAEFDALDFHALPEIPQPRDDPRIEHKPATKEEAAKGLAKIREMLGS